MNGPIFTTVPVSNPDFCTFSQKFAKFSEKISPEPPSPRVAHPRGESPAAVYTQ